MSLTFETLNWGCIGRIQALCREAGTFQLRHFRTQPPGKGDEKDEKQYVSWVDIETEKILQQGLRGLYPEAGFFGEETGQTGSQDLQWLVDPLDGTSNYLSGLEQFSISVALIHQAEPELAVIYKPVSDEFFTAIRGQGARHNEKILPIQEPLVLSKALIGTGFPYRSGDLIDPFFACTRDVLRHTRGIRRMGSAALDLSYVAAGYLQGFWESELQAYDIAAALLMLSETGCSYSSIENKPYDMFHDRIFIAGVPGVFEELSDIVTRHYSSAIIEN